MKKLFSTLFILFLISFSVSPQNMTFRTYQIIIRHNDEVKKMYHSSTIIFLDASPEKRTIHINPGLTYYIIDNGEVTDKGIDEDGDEYEIMIFKAIDNERDDCSVYIKRWPGLKYMHFYIEYPGVEISYLTIRID